MSMSGITPQHPVAQAAARTVGYGLGSAERGSPAVQAYTADGEVAVALGSPDAAH